MRLWQLLPLLITSPIDDILIIALAGVLTRLWPRHRKEKAQ